MPSDNFANELTTTAFNWTIDKKQAHKSIFLKQKMKEYADYRKVVGFIHNRLGSSYVGKDKYSHLIANKITTEQKHIELYQNMFDHKENCFLTGYQLSKHKWGRVVPNGYTSVSIFRRGLRHAICKDIYVDIDMVCCQPKIIYEICKSNGQELLVPSLRLYTDDSTKYRHDIMDAHGVDYDSAKGLVNSLIFGGSYTKWKRANNIDESVSMPIIVDMENQIKSIINLVYRANPQIKADVLKATPNKWKSEDDAKRGVMGLWGQTVERFIQEAAISYLVTNKGIALESIVSCQDGFMILADYYYDGLLSEIEGCVMDEFNMEMKFIVKPFDQAIDIPEYTQGKSLAEWRDTITVKPLSQRLIENFKDYIMIHEETKQLFVFYNSRWYNETDSKERMKLTRYISEDLYALMKREIVEDSGLKKEDKDKLLEDLRHNTSAASRMAEIITHAKSIIEPTNQEFDTNPFLLGFNNGVFDLKKHIFRPYEYSDYMTMSVGYDFNTNIDIDHLNEEEMVINDQLVEFFDSIQPNPEDVQLLFQILASGLDGIAYQKMFFYNGRGGNGKGAIGSLMSSILGGYYAQPSNGILYDIEKAGVASPELMSLRGKRYVNFKEVEGVLKASVVRNLTGGGNFSARNLHSNLVTFQMSASFVMEFNNHPDLSGKPQESDYRRMVDFQFPTIFTDNQEKVGMIVGDNVYRQSNPYFVSQEFVTKSRDIFLHMLLKVYKTYRAANGMVFNIPTHIIDRTDKYLKNQNVFYSIFSRNWEKCDVMSVNGKMDKEDKESKTFKVKDLWTGIQQDEEYRNLGARAKKSLYNRDAFYDWLSENYTVQTVQKVQLIIGLRKICDENEDTE